jgi:hypothetical protein
LSSSKNVFPFFYFKLLFSGALEQEEARVPILPYLRSWAETLMLKIHSGSRQAIVSTANLTSIKYSSLALNSVLHKKLQELEKASLSAVFKWVERKLLSIKFNLEAGNNFYSKFEIQKKIVGPPWFFCERLGVPAQFWPVLIYDLLWH